MTDELIEQIKEAHSEHLACFDEDGNWIPGRDVSPLEAMAENLADRILADAEVIKAAEALVSRLNKLQTYFDLTAEEFDNLTHDEQADTIRQHMLITETIEAFNRAKQGRKGCGPDDKE